MYKINIVEDEARLRKLLSQYLIKEGYEVNAYESAEEAVLNLNEEVHLWILDIMLPKEDGYSLFTKIKQAQGAEIPIIFTSARDSDLDKIMGLELGSDDYLTKPFTPSELILRVKNILRRVYRDSSDNNFLKYKEYVINKQNRKVYLNNEEITLTTKEYDLLLYFVSRANTAIPREEILMNIWDEFYYGSDRVVDDTIRRLRKKMEYLDIETIYGFGYRLK